MLNTVSMTGVGGAIVVVLQVLFPAVGIDLPEGGVVALVEAGVVLVGTAMLIYGQLRRKDLTAGILRK